MRHLLNTLFVTDENAYLSFKNDNVLVNDDEEIKASIPLRALEHILCFSYKGASPALMGRCAENNVSMSFYSPRGRYYCSIFGEKNRNVLLRLQQFHQYEDERRCVPIARNFLIGKLFNSRWVLERATRDHPFSPGIDAIKQASKYIKTDLSQLNECVSISDLRAVEGNAARIYFSVFDSLILKSKKCFFFHERSRRPPMDRMNALLSFIYVLLSNQCAGALQGVGLDPYVGFMHVCRSGRPALALDLMEELRPCVADRLALALVNSGAISAKDFETHESGGVFLNDNGRKIVLTYWQKHALNQLTHPYLQEKIPWGLVPYVQALLLARFVRGDLDQYPPFMWK